MKAKCQRSNRPRTAIYKCTRTRSQKQPIFLCNAIRTSASPCATSLEAETVVILPWLHPSDTVIPAQTGNQRSAAVIPAQAGNQRSEGLRSMTILANVASQFLRQVALLNGNVIGCHCWLCPAVNPSIAVYTSCLLKPLNLLKRTLDLSCSTITVCSTPHRALP